MPYRILLSVMLVGLAFAPAARADFMYTFEQTGTSNSFSFTVADILMATTNPLMPAIGLSVGGFTINDATLEVDGLNFCFSFSTIDALQCGWVAPGAGLVLTNPTAVGVYTPINLAASGGFPGLNRLTISEVSAVIPEPTSLVLLGTVAAGWPGDSGGSGLADNQQFYRSAGARTAIDARLTPTSRTRAYCAGPPLVLSVIGASDTTTPSS